MKLRNADIQNLRNKFVHDLGWGKFENLGVNEYIHISAFFRNQLTSYISLPFSLLEKS